MDSFAEVSMRNLRMALVALLLAWHASGGLHGTSVPPKEEVAFHREVVVRDSGRMAVYVVDLAAKGTAFQLEMEVRNAAAETIFVLVDDRPVVGADRVSLILTIGATEYGGETVPRMRAVPAGGSVRWRCDGVLPTTVAKFNFIEISFFVILDHGAMFEREFRKLDGDDRSWFLPTNSPLWIMYYQHFLNETIAFPSPPIGW